MAAESEEVRAMKEELKWVTIHEKSANTFWEKTRMKTLSNPIVPIGCLVTCGVLSLGLYNFFIGDRVKQQKMMRFRVLAQGVTLAAAVFSIYASGKIG